MKFLTKALQANPIIWPFRPNGLYAFNYHRIGEPTQTDFDPNVFSCTAERFQQQIKFLKSNFDIIDVSVLNQLIKAKQPIKERLAVITFDDGYIDNYQVAFPILQAEKTSACFYVVTDFIDKGLLPWWDEIAFIIKKTQAESIKLPHWTNSISLEHLSTSDKIRKVLKLFKSDNSCSMIDKIGMLKVVLNWQEQSYPNEILFMTWQHIKEMHKCGMSIGSQTCSHRIMSHLSNAEQNDEIIRSKMRISEELGTEINSFAYPVGSKDAFNQHSIEALKKANFDHAFSFIPGINRKISGQEHLLKRFSIDNNCSINQLKKQINKATLMFE